MDRRVFTSAHKAGMQETYEIMFTSGMWNDSSGERYEVLTEALVKIQSSGVRCCVTWASSSWRCKDFSVLNFRVKQSTNNFNFPPLQYLIIIIIIINSFYFFTFTPNLPAVSIDAASTIPSDLPPSVASHYPHHHTYCTQAVCLHCYSSWNA